MVYTISSSYNITNIHILIKGKPRQKKHAISCSRLRNDSKNLKLNSGIRVHFFNYYLMLTTRKYIREKWLFYNIDIGLLSNAKEIKEIPGYSDIIPKRISCFCIGQVP